MRANQLLKPAVWAGMSVAASIFCAGTSQAQPWQPVGPLAKVERVVKIDALPPVAITVEAAAKFTAALDAARGGGKYRTLLAQIARPEDAGAFGNFNDHGQVQEAAWRGIGEAPAGYWVYVQPYWYVWRDLAAQPRLSRSWGTEQATGAPNTEEVGDRSTAWASRTPDGQPEWLALEFDQPITPAGVKIYESNQPGAVNRVTGFTLDGQEVELWQGDDPTRGLAAIGVLSLQFQANFKINRVKVYLDSPAVPGWNEIDAVGLIDDAGKPHWANEATASSCYAEPDRGQVVVPPLTPEQLLAQTVRTQLAAGGFTEKALQDAVVEFVQAQEKARQPLRAMADRLSEASRAKEAADTAVSNLVNEFRAAIEDEKTRSEAALAALNTKIDYRKKPRLEALLMLLGYIGDESWYLRPPGNNAGQKELPVVFRDRLLLLEAEGLDAGRLDGQRGLVGGLEPAQPEGLADLGGLADPAGLPALRGVGK